MDREYLVQGNLNMTRGSVLRIDDGCDLLLYVWEGEVWLTQDNDRRDRIINAGGWFRLDRNGTAIAAATQRSVVTLTAPQPEQFASRILLTKAGSAEPIELYAAAKEQASLGARLRRFWTGLYAPHARPTTVGL